MVNIDEKPLEFLTILVVDDQKFIRSMIAQGLRGFGATVIEAADGFEALTILGISDGMSAGTLEALKRQRSDLFHDIGPAEQKIDCVVSDIRMVPMNGLEMLKAIRVGMSKAPRDIPVVIVSAHSDEALIGAAVALDAQGFVAKPVSRKTVSDCIVRACQLPLLMKPANIYKLLVIPELDAATIETDVGKLAESVVAIIRAGDVAAATGQASVEIVWLDLKVGDVLNENFSTKRGRLVVPAGARVTEVLLSALHDLSHITELMEKVSIRRKAI
jgi:two-component system, chemotaxis family, chemotaxis protein CheY